MGQYHDRMEQDLKLRNLSAATRKIYLNCARQFVAHFHRPPTELGEREIRLYLLHLMEVEQISHGTYRQCLAALKFLYTVTLKQDWQIHHIPFPKHQQTLPVPLSAEQVIATLSAIKKSKYRVLLITMYTTGLRISEACQLCVQDIDSKRMVLRVRDGKGGKDRYTILPPPLLKILREYWLIEKPRTWLFPSQLREGCVTARSVRMAFKLALAKAGISGKFTPHTLRHSFATHLLDAGMELIVIKALLGHRRLRTTTRYTHVSAKTIHRAIAPVNQFPVWNALKRPCY